MARKRKPPLPWAGQVESSHLLLLRSRGCRTRVYAPMRGTRKTSRFTAGFRLREQYAGFKPATFPLESIIQRLTREHVVFSNHDLLPTTFDSLRPRAKHPSPSCHSIPLSPPPHYSLRNPANRSRAWSASPGSKRPHKAAVPTFQLRVSMRNHPGALRKP